MCVNDGELWSFCFYFLFFRMKGSCLDASGLSITHRKEGKKEETFWKLTTCKNLHSFAIYFLRSHTKLSQFTSFLVIYSTKGMLFISSKASISLPFELSCLISSERICKKYLYNGMKNRIFSVKQFSIHLREFSVPMPTKKRERWTFGKTFYGLFGRMMKVEFAALLCHQYMILRNWNHHSSISRAFLECWARGGWEIMSNWERHQRE